MTTQRLIVTFLVKKVKFLYKSGKMVQKCENPCTSSANFSPTVWNYKASDPILEASFTDLYENTPSYKLNFRPRKARGV